MKLHEARQPFSATLSQMIVYGTSGQFGCMKFILSPLLYALMAVIYSVEVLLRFRIGELYIRFSQWIAGIIVIYLYQVVAYSNFTWTQWNDWIWDLFTNPGYWITTLPSFIADPLLMQFILVTFVIGVGHHILARMMRQRNGGWAHPSTPGESWLFYALKSRLPNWNYKITRFIGEGIIVILVGLFLGNKGYVLFDSYIVLAGIGLIVKAACFLNLERYMILANQAIHYDPVTMERNKVSRSGGRKAGKKPTFTVQQNPNLKNRRH